jgi:Peptidase family S41
VPFNAAVATRFIEYYNTTLLFQSTLAFLKNPPQGYQQPAVDVLAGLQQIQDNVTAGHYRNQYSFEADLQLLVYSMHDDHVALTSGILSAFSFASPYAITAASPDGKQAPRVYITGKFPHAVPHDCLRLTDKTLDDIIDSQKQSWQPSPIVSINGEDVVSYLTLFAALNSMGTIEPNGDWNELMDTPALDIQGFLPIFSGAATFYPGDALNFTFANGTELDTFWLALYNNPDPTGPLTTGGDFYNYFVLGLLPASFNSSQASSSGNTNLTSTDNSTLTNPSTATTSWFNVSSGAYPDNPDIAQQDLSVEGGGVVTGYFLKDISTGVLSLPTFDQSGWSVGNFSQTVANFISRAQEAKLTHVVIDLQQNVGGNTELAFDTFHQFFPGIDPFAGSRRRSHQLANVLGGATTAYWNSLPVNDVHYVDLAADEWVVTDRLNAATGRNFTSWEEYYGPVADNGDAFSLTVCQNIGSPPFLSSSCCTKPLVY